MERKSDKVQPGSARGKPTPQTVDVPDGEKRSDFLTHWREGPTDSEWFRRRQQDDRLWWWVTRGLEAALLIVVLWCWLGGKGV